MSYFQCPDCSGKHKIFGESHIEDIEGNWLDPIVKAIEDK